jgi:hypothetical protein
MGLEANESNERLVREKLRAEHGMAAYAKLSMPQILKAMEDSRTVILDGVYSWENTYFCEIASRTTSSCWRSMHPLLSDTKGSAEGY